MLNISLYWSFIAEVAEIKSWLGSLTVLSKMVWYACTCIATARSGSILDTGYPWLSCQNAGTVIAMRTVKWRTELHPCGVRSALLCAVECRALVTMALNVGTMMFAATRDTLDGYTLCCSQLWQWQQTNVSWTVPPLLQIQLNCDYRSRKELISVEKTEEDDTNFVSSISRWVDLLQQIL